MGERVGQEIAESDGEQKDVKSAAAKDRAAEKKRCRAAALSRRDSMTAQQRRDCSDRIIENLTNQSCYQNADAVLTYISFRSEVDTIPLLKQAFSDGKAVFAPKVTGKEMEFYRIFSTDDLAAGYRGILEPAGGLSFDVWITDQESQHHGSQQEKPAEAKKWTRMEKPAAAEMDEDETAFTHILICLPGSAFDKTRHRIGYGGGFYDRYLSRLLLGSENMDATAQPQALAKGTKHFRMKVMTAALAYDCQIFEEIPWEAHDMCPARIITESKII